LGALEGVPVAQVQRRNPQATPRFVSARVVPKNNEYHDLSRRIGLRPANGLLEAGISTWEAAGHNVSSCVVRAPLVANAPSTPLKAIRPLSGIAIINRGADLTVAKGEGFTPSGGKRNLF
jgi:hypothetical protein